ncbi:MauE/DoxX family redox-associated membrane protein [Cohnella nanjingensis]|uniref:Methylamine utilisation protein MauE domain-containing protein n=1 Tax=Cohnella nanjingensis TaxID=1387779 RepID=A0A7X0RSS5_9BACL|nr:MauE/DoxX family redox-associated membrane protein [Cohnella nanjingensis]MBB6672905.1 hypothetical protein [Cohnella nanjingensis]
MEWIALGIDYVAAVAFLASGYAKAAGFANFAMEIIAHRIVPARAASGIAIAVLAAEFGLGLAFCAGDVGPRGIKEAAAVALLLLFTGLTRRRHRTQRRREGAGDACGCFGAHHPLSRFPLQRNAALIVLLLAGGFIGRGALPLPAAGLFAGAVVCAVLALETLKLAYETGRRRSDVSA